jgi:predicted permease
MELIKWMTHLAPQRQKVPLAVRVALTAALLVVLAPVDLLASALPAGRSFAAIAVYCGAVIGGAALYLDRRQGNRNRRHWQSVRTLVGGCLIAAAVVWLF